MNQPICFVASARDYHAIDWYRAVKILCPSRRVFIATDLIQSEGVPKIINDSDEVAILFNIDKFLLNTQSKAGNLWRNIVKIFMLPVMAFKLNKLSKEADTIFHAHSMFYIFLCWFARIDFIATPMGSDVLVRPDKSKLYKFFAVLSLRSAKNITVDSNALQEKIRMITGRESYLVQNGIDCKSTLIFRKNVRNRTKLISVRGMDPNYRISELVEARNFYDKSIFLDFIFPFEEEKYLLEVKAKLTKADRIHGRVEKNQMYKMLGDASVVFSIPISDSSPRSVYEAIFCGACVVVSQGKWIDLLPNCMKSRIIVIDVSEKNWFESAINSAKEISAVPFVPSSNAIELFDEIESMKYVCKTFYGADFHA